MQKTTRIAFLAAAALALPATAAAQQPQPAQPAAPAQATAPAQDEVAQIQQRLAALQQQAMQDPGVQAEKAAFDQYLLGAMAKLDPTFTEKRSRAEALKAEVEAARAASDNAKLNLLAVEAQGLASYFAGLNQRAGAQADVQERRQAYVAKLFARMTAIDPQAQTLADRLAALRSGGASAPSQR